MTIEQDNLRVECADLGADLLGCPPDRLIAEALRPSAVELLLGVARRLGSEMSLASRAACLLDAISGLSGADDVGVALLDETISEIQLVAVRGAVLHAGDRSPADHGVLGAVTSGRRSLVLDDVWADARFDGVDIGIDVTTRSWIGVPLLSAAGPIGAIFASSPEAAAFGPDIEGALIDLAGIAAGYLQDARRLDTAKAEVDRLAGSCARQRDVIAATADWMWEQDHDLRFTWVAAVGSRGQLRPTFLRIGRRLDDVVVTGDDTEYWTRCLTDLQARRPFRDVQTRWTAPDGSIRTISLSGKPVFDGRDAFRGYRGTAVDVTVRPPVDALAEVVERARADKARLTTTLALREREQAALADLEVIALGGGDPADLIHLTTQVLADVLQTDVSYVVRCSADGESFLIEDNSGWDDELVGTTLPVEAGSLGHLTLCSTGPVVIAGLSADEPAGLAVLLRQHGLEHGVMVPIGAPGQPYGVLGAHARRAMVLAEADLQFVVSLARLVALAVERDRLGRIADACIEQAPDLVTRLDGDLRCIYANTAFGVATGLELPFIFGRSLDDLGLVPPEQIGSWRAAVRSVLRSGRQRECELSLDTAQGERRYRVRLVSDLAIGQTNLSVLAVAHDITEARRLREECSDLRHELIEQERRHHELVSQLLVEQREQLARDDDAALIAEQLTPREVEILGMLTAGLTNQQIAARLHLSAGTVRNHLGRLFPKLDAADRTQAAVRAVELGLTRIAEA